MEKVEAKEERKKLEGSAEAPKEKTNEVYFYHPRRFPIEGVETLSEKEIEKTRAEIKGKLQDLLKVINEETLQLIEFLKEEKNLTHELCTMLRQILKHLNLSFNIPRTAIPLPEKTKQVVLNEESHLIIVYENGQVDSKFLEEYPPKIIMAVLWEILPELGKSIELYRRKISARVSFFEKIKRELKKISKVFTSSEAKQKESPEERGDAIKKGPSGEEYRGVKANEESNPK